MYPEEFRQHLNKGLELLIEKRKIHGRIGWLANTKLLVTMQDEDAKWITEDWSPRAVAASLRYIAVVMPEDEILRLSTNVFDEDYKVLESGLTYRHFSDVVSASESLHRSLNAD